MIALGAIENPFLLIHLMKIDFKGVKKLRNFRFLAIQ